MSVVEYNKVKSPFKGKTILITGTTGFIGKVYLEKILRSIPDVGRILAIARNNGKHANAKGRFEAEVLSSSLFDRIKADSPNSLEKIEVVDCELTKVMLGMTEEEFNSIGQQVDLIVNCAASVNFREELDKAININTQSLFSLAKMAKTHDIPFLQISTCYVHGYHNGRIMEDLRDPFGGKIKRSGDGFYDIKGLITDFKKQIDKTVSECATPEEHSPALINLGIETANHYGWNDTYTMTKWMGEAYLQKELSGQTLTIVRPAIVESCLNDPTPGWIEGVKVADAVILAYARQKTSFLPGNKTSTIDVIPVDLVVNAMVLASAEALQQHRRVKIYQVGSSCDNPITMDEFHHILEETCLSSWQKLDRLFYVEPKKRFKLVNRSVFKWILRCLALILKVQGRLAGSGKSKAAYIQFQTTMSLATVFGFYMASTYQFDTTQLKKLSTNFGVFSDDFPIDAQAINWQNYLTAHVEGLNKYSLKPRKIKTSDLKMKDAKRTAA